MSNKILLSEAIAEGHVAKLQETSLSLKNGLMSMASSSNMMPCTQMVKAFMETTENMGNLSSVMQTDSNRIEKISEDFIKKDTELAKGIANG